MNTLPKLPKVLAILLISLLLVPFVFGATLELAPKYVNIVFPILLLIVLALGIGLYYRSTHKKSANH